MIYKQRVIPFHIFQHSFVVLVLCLVCCLPLQARPAYGQQLDLYKSILRTTPQGLQLHLACTLTDEESLRELLKDGATIALSLHIVLERHSSWWSNSTEREETFVFKVHHDSLTREFVMQMPPQLQLPAIREKNLTRLLHQTWRNINVQVCSAQELAALDTERSYALSITLDTRHVEVPPWLEKSTLFWSAEVAPSLTLELPLTLPPRR